MGTRIAVSDYIAEPEWTRPLIKDEWRLVFESKLEIFQCIGQWHAENQQLGLSPEISDNWTPAQRQSFTRLER